MNNFIEDNQKNKPLIYYRNDYFTMHHSHIHPYYEIYFCTEGIAQSSVINGVEYVYDHPCVIISSPYTIHSMSCSDIYADSCGRYIMYFEEKLFDSFAPHLVDKEFRRKNSGLMFSLESMQADYLKSMLEQISPQTTAETELAIIVFLNKLIGFCPVDKVIKVGTSSFYIQDVLQYISEKSSEPIFADAVAKKFAISRSKLYRDFKKHTGDTIHAYIDACKINLAKSLLLSTENYSISDVAKLCGFQNETYFFPFFKKHVYQTPIEYRKNTISRK